MDLPTDLAVQRLCTRLTANKRVRRSLTGTGRIHVDRQLPFLCLYRRPPSNRDAGTERLVTGQAAYLILSADKAAGRSGAHLVREVVRTLSPVFGGFLVVEVWASPAREADPAHAEGPRVARFRIVTRHGEKDRLSPCTDALQRALGRIRPSPVVETAASQRVAPPWTAPILPARRAAELDCSLLGLEIDPIYRDPETGVLFPLLLRSLRRSITRALQRALFEFARTSTRHRPRNFHALGRRAFVKAVFDVDRRLMDVDRTFDFLLQVTPVNGTAAWHRFRRARFQRPPTFRYRPLPVDPDVLKRHLYAVPLERVEDPTLDLLFRQKRRELDRKLTMLLDRNTPAFLLGSQQLFGTVDDEEQNHARSLLEGLPRRTRSRQGGGALRAEAVLERAREEIEAYRRAFPDFTAKATIREEIGAGLMVSFDALLIGPETRIPPGRVQALLDHEVGTHLVTYFNGSVQPLEHLRLGLAGYEELQEGLAVLAEHLSGGLTPARLRVLAARVMAVGMLVRGATFIDTFRTLNRAYGFDQYTAYTITLRVHRSGGLTKDAVYLRGLLKVLDHLREGGDLEPLLVGKIAADHIPVIKELRHRGVLRPPALIPRYLRRPEASERLERIRSGVTIQALAERSS